MSTKKTHLDYHGRKIEIGDRVRFAKEIEDNFRFNNFHQMASTVENLVDKHTVIVKKIGPKHVPAHRAEALEVIDDQGRPKGRIVRDFEGGP